MKNIYWYDEAGLKTILENGTRYEFVTTSNPTYTQVADLLYGKGAVAVNEGTAVSNYAVATAESVGGTIAAPQMLETSVVEEVGGGYKLIAETPQAVTTAGGTELSAGAVATKASPVPVVMAALYGAGLGWESYKEYPQFWTDLSNTLIQTEGYANDPDNRFLTDNVLGACKIVIRAVEDGGLQAYCDKRSLEKIYQKAFEEGVFVTESSTEPTYSRSGVYPFTSGGVGFDYEMSLGGYPLLSRLSSTAIAELKANRHIIDPSGIANAFSIAVYVSERQISYSVNLYHITADTITITVNNDYSAFDLTGFMGLYGLRFDPLTYEDQGIYYDFNNSEYAAILKGTYVKRHDSSINATVTTPKPGILINPDCDILTSPDNFDTQFADWIAQGWDSTEYNPETGQNETTTWLPIQIPDINNNESVNPTPEGQTATQSGAIPSPEGVLPPQYPTGLKDLLDKLGITIPEVPEGQTPTIVAPTGPTSTASKLYTVYNPSNAQLDSLGSYLWSPSAVDTLKQLFTNSPLEAIISLHQVYCAVSTSGSKNIILGSLDSGVSSPVVSNQYVQLSCGSVSVPTLYDDARDYDNTSCEMYLPFCGIVSLDPNDVIGRTVKVDYTIDLFTGTCLATLTITKDGLSQVLYNFEGNCSVMVPLTSRDRTAIAGSAISAVAGIATSLVTKNPTAAVAGVAGGAVGIGTSGQSVGHTGSFTGNAGAMGIKKPYIIVTRNKSQDPVGFKSYYGFPTSRTVNLSTISGYVRVEDIKLSSLTCTDTEKDMLETLLKGGVYI